jgi:MFS family permease
MPDDAPPTLCCGLSYDLIAAFVTRFLRMFNYGALAPVFYLYLTRIGFSSIESGIMLTAILCGDLVISLWLSTRADIFGRRATLVVASLLKILVRAATSRCTCSFSHITGFPSHAASRLAQHSHFLEIFTCWLLLELLG